MRERGSFFSLVLVTTLAVGITAQTNTPDNTAASLRKLLDEGHYAAAVTLATEWHRQVEATDGAESLSAAIAADWVVEALIRNGRSADAETVRLATAAVAVKRRLGHDGDGMGAASLHNLGMLRSERRELAEARTLLERAVTIRRRAAAADGAALADSLDQLGLALIRSERFRDAERNLRESQRLRAETGSTLGRSRNLFIIALLFRHDGSYQRAADTLEQAAGAHDLPPEHPDRASMTELRGDLAMLRGDPSAAERAWADAAVIVERSLRPDHPMMVKLLRARGIARWLTGDLVAARAFYRQAAELAARTLTECHEESAAVLGDMASLEKEEGNYPVARRFESRALGLHERCLGGGHSLTATSVHNLAVIAEALGDYPEAERLHARAVQLWSHQLGAEHPYVARGLDSLAGVVAARGQRLRARTLFTRALRIRQHALGPEHPDVAWTLVSLAELSAASGALTTARQQIDSAIAIYQRDGGEKRTPSRFARALVFRGNIEMRRGRYAEARRSFAEALELRERTLGSHHPASVEARKSVATAALALGAPEDALRLALDAEDDGRDHVRQTIRYLPERQALGYAVARPGGLDLLLSVASTADDGVAAEVFDAVIRSRGLVLDEIAARTRLDRGTDPQVASLSAAVVSARQRFATLTYRSLRGDETVSAARLERVRQEKEDVERQLAETSAVTETDSVRAKIGLAEVRAALPASTALISFVRYDRSVPRTINGHLTLRTVPSYAAFVLRSSDPRPRVVAIGSASSVEGAIAAWRAEVSGRSSQAAPSAAARERIYRTVGTALRMKIWDPVAALVGGMSRVLIVPDGMINVVAFASLPVAGNRFLVENGQAIHYLTTERDAVPLESARTGRGLLAVGGAAFDDRPFSPRGDIARRTGCEVGVAPLQFENLPMALKEAQDVAGIWATVHNRPGEVGMSSDTRILSGRTATKQAVTTTMKGRQVVHLSTHGFFLDSRCTKRGSSAVSASTMEREAAFEASHPLLLSGLAFAGANRAGNTPAADGILTAEEVAALNLQGTEWVVLSACDTGIGEIRVGEGVFGLRRAFQIAGVRTIVMSLWSVEDEATRVWMRALYDARLRRGASTDRSMTEASVRVLNARRSRGESTHPFYWAAFVAAGDWR